MYTSTYTATCTSTLTSNLTCTYIATSTYFLLVIIIFIMRLLELLLHLIHALLFYLYLSNAKLKHQIIESQLISQQMQNNFDQAIALNVEKQKELERVIIKQQKLRLEQNITLQDKKCISKEFIDKINENF